MVDLLAWIRVPAGRAELGRAGGVHAAAAVAIAAHQVLEN
jgi:hypothetical protein